MKTIFFKKTPPPPPVPPRIEIMTQLTGRELVAYVTNSGSICLLARLTKDYKDPAQYAFFNMAYSESTGPTFAGSSWLDAVKKAGAARELFAFDNYQELIEWISKPQIAAALGAHHHSPPPLEYPINISDWLLIKDMVRDTAGNILPCWENVIKFMEAINLIKT